MLLKSNTVTSEEITPPSENPNAEEYEPGSGGYNPNSEVTVKPYSDYGGNWKQYLEDLVASGDSAAADKLIGYLMSEESAQTARDWTASREDTQYQRLVDDLKSAGINPYAILATAGSPVSSGSNGNSYSGSQFTTKHSQEESERHNRQSESLKILTTMLMAAAMVFAAVL